jgi:hypothetical protein
MEVIELKVLSDYDPSCGLHVYILLIFLGTSHTAAIAMADCEVSISNFNKNNNTNNSDALNLRDQLMI